MNETLYFDDIAYISASNAAQYFGVTRDYITKLCRLGKLKARRVEKNWYVAEHAFKEYLLIHLYQKSARREALTVERLKEYKESTPLRVKAHSVVSSTVLPRHRSREESALSIREKMAQAVARQGSQTAATVSPYLNVPAGIAQAAVQTTHIPVYTLTPFIEIAHRLTALLFALFFVFGLYALAHPTYTYTTFSLVREGASEMLDNPSFDATSLYTAPISMLSNTYLGALAAAPITAATHLGSASTLATARMSLSVFSKRFTSYSTALLTNTLASGTASSSLGAAVSVTIVPLSAENVQPTSSSTLLHTNSLCTEGTCAAQPQALPVAKISADQPTSTARAVATNNTFRPIMIGTSTVPRPRK